MRTDFVCETMEGSGMVLWIPRNDDARAWAAENFAKDAIVLNGEFAGDYRLLEYLEEVLIYHGFTVSRHRAREGVERFYPRDVLWK